MARAPTSTPPNMGRHKLKALLDGNAGTRAISDAAAAGLGFSLTEFGDISGIVLSKRTGRLICGHRRIEQLRAAGATEWTRDGDGGHVTHPKTGERFPIRVVDWDAAKEKAARYAANASTIAGEFTALALPELGELAALPDLALLGLDDLVTSLLTASPPPEFPPYDESVVDGVATVACPKCGHVFPK